MIERILLAVDDSPDSFAAARIAIELAAALHADLRAVHVGADHAFDKIVEAASGRPHVHARRREAGAAALARVAALAAASGVKAQIVMLTGDIAAAILDDARDWAANLIVMGRSARSASGEPGIGSRSRYVLEFADQPVLIVSP